MLDKRKGGRLRPRKVKHWPWQHSYTRRAVGHYYSITGPRTIVAYSCECGHEYRDTVLGDL